MKKVSSELARTVAGEIEREIGAILQRHGLGSPTLKVTYGDYFAVTVKASQIEEGPNGINLATPEATYYARFGWDWIPTSSDGTWLPSVALTAPLGTRFTVAGASYVFAGIAPRRKKFPIVCREERTGKTVFHTERVIPAINGAVES